ncbi:hypothetical protein phi16_gp011 [Corynebacterium phage phi16]|uniref:hypothetical protein n=1 Tax=Corynebacterium glutamicum TaxID=1718 RepID=UPI000942D673|nr:hypothetical protein [Corynebacterium glutamicum]APQ42516.1 hypothetical protein phi16_gp011 [Corynebacterium phage phi16]OKX80487.1 hypothetical protein AUO95_10055 [Corynebacterium glutamicum]
MAKTGKLTISLDSKRLMEWVAEAYKKDVEDASEELGELLRTKLPDDVPVDVNHYIAENGRPVSVATIAHPSGLARQAKDGICTRSAAELGFKVTRTEDG